MSKILLIITGASSAMFSPFHLKWAMDTYPGIELRILLTKSAKRFVRINSLSLILGKEVISDDWDKFSSHESKHVELALWADGIVVCPASLNYINSFTNGLADRPSLSILQMFSGPIVFAPSFPPGTSASRWLEPLREFSQTKVLNFSAAYSAGLGQVANSANVSILDGIKAIKEMLDDE